MVVARILAPLRDKRDVQAATDALTELNNHYRNRYASGIELLSSGVRYQREPAGREDWQTIPLLLRAGRGDCEDLATAYAAEVGGRPRVIETAIGYHVVTVMPSGRIVDPSRLLGM